MTDRHRRLVPLAAAGAVMVLLHGKTSAAPARRPAEPKYSYRCAQSPEQVVRGIDRILARVWEADMSKWKDVREVSNDGRLTVVWKSGKVTHPPQITNVEIGMVFQAMNLLPAVKKGHIPAAIAMIDGLCDPALYAELPSDFDTVAYPKPAVDRVCAAAVRYLRSQCPRSK